MRKVEGILILSAILGFQGFYMLVRERDKGGCRWVRVRGVQKVWTQR